VRVAAATKISKRAKKNIEFYIAPDSMPSAYQIPFKQAPQTVAQSPANTLVNIAHPTDQKPAI